MKSKQYILESELPIDQFTQQLRENVSPDKNLISLNSHDFSHKPFCGTFDASTFNLTKNTFWKHIKSITIVGSYAQNGTNGTTVSYSVGVNKMATLLFLLITIMIIGLNALFFIANVREQEFYLVVNGWILFMYLFGLISSKIFSFIVNQKFKTVFEIDVKETDRFGYGNDI